MEDINPTTVSSNNMFPVEENFKIHIQVQKRNARKNITTVVGLDLIDLDLKKIVKSFKKTFQCNGTIDEGPKIPVSEQKRKKPIGAILLSGDQRQNVKQFLIENDIVKEEFIIVHGY